MENVKVTDISARYTDGSVMQLFNLSWEHNGALYGISDIFPDVLLKRTDGNVRRLSAHAKCNIKLIAQARAVLVTA